MAAPTASDSVPINTLIHLITIKLTSSNYLLWRNQVIPMLVSYDLLEFVDGTTNPPLATIVSAAGETSPNPAFTAWRTKDQQILSLILSSLTEESLAEVIGCTTSRAVWLALEPAFAHSSQSRANQLREELLFLKHGSLSVADYGHKFKNLCDELAAIGRPVDDPDKSHWFLRGLGPHFASFADTRMALSPVPSFRDLLHQAQQFDIFSHSMDGSSPAPVAFVASNHRDSHAQQSRPVPSSGHYSNKGTHGHSNRGGHGSSRRGGHSSSGRGGRKSYVPRCQICRGEHYADKCPQFFQARAAASSSAQLVQAFNASCNVSEPTSDWYVDSGASAHMTSQPSALDSIETYNGNGQVIVGNGNSNENHF